MEKKRLESGCSAVLQGSVGKKVVVELRGENYVIGTIESCDSNLNLRLLNVTVIRDAQKTEQSEYFVLGRHIRFVHFEHQVNTTAAIRRCIKGVGGGRPKPNRRLDQKQYDSGKKIIDQ
uniref:Sm domain-containing protein n=1 Tax=Caenorhabditis tropicalis TaxID=1561998 RepID=A0A1I7U475_9PELO